MEKKDKNGNYLSTYVRKITTSGSSFCICCNKPLVYGSTDKKDLLKDAAKSTEHLSSKKNYLSTTLLPLHQRKPTSSSSSDISTCTPLARKCTMPYGVAENVHTTVTCLLMKENILHLIVSVSDCISSWSWYLIFCCRKFITAINRPYKNYQFLSRDSRPYLISKWIGLLCLISLNMGFQFMFLKM